MLQRSYDSVTIAMMNARVPTTFLVSYHFGGEYSWKHASSDAERESGGFLETGRKKELCPFRGQYGRDDA